VMQDHVSEAVQRWPPDQKMTVYDVIGRIPRGRRPTTGEARHALGHLVRTGCLLHAGFERDNLSRIRQYRRA
jgi:hypothetical protein